MAQGGRWHAVPLGSAGGEAGWPPGPRTQMHQPPCCPPHREPRLCSRGRRPRGRRAPHRGQRTPLHDSGLRPGPGPAAHGGPRGTWLHLPGTRGQIALAPTRPASQTPAPRWCSGRGPVPGGLRVLVPRTDRQMGPGPRSTHRGEARQTGNADALGPRPRRRLAGARRPRRGQADMRGVCVQWPVYPNTTGPSQLRARTAAPESSGEHLISFAAAFLECSPYTKETTHTGQMPAVEEKNAGLGTRRRSGAV